MERERQQNTVSPTARLGTASLNMYMASLGAWAGAGGWPLFQELLTTLRKVASSHCLSTAVSLSSTAVSLLCHCLSTAVSLPCHCRITAVSLPFHCCVH